MPTPIKAGQGPPRSPFSLIQSIRAKNGFVILLLFSFNVIDLVSIAFLDLGYLLLLGGSLGFVFNCYSRILPQKCQKVKPCYGVSCVIQVTYSLRSCEHLFALFGRLINLIYLYLFVQEYPITLPPKSQVQTRRVACDIPHMTNGANRTLTRGTTRPTS